MANTIPLSKDFTITTNTVSPAGTALYANGLMLSTSTNIPASQLTYFYTLADVGSLFGTESDEYICASVYFNGFENSANLPATLLVAGISAINSATSGGLISGSLADTTLETLTSTPAGTITLNVDGTSQTSATIDMSTAGAPSDVAIMLQTALPSVNVVWNAGLSRLYVYSKTTGSASVVSPADTSDIATVLKLTSAAGASSFNGTPSASLTSIMDSVVNQDQNWVAFASAQTLTDDQNIELATWNTAQTNRYIYAFADDSTDAVTSGSSTAAAVVANAAGYTGIFPVYGEQRFAFMALAYCASLDFSATNGRVTFKFRQFSGLTPNVTTLSVAKALESNHYNYYGAYSQNATLANYAAPGNILGDFDWIDSYVDQVVIKANLIAAYAALFLNNQSYAFNATGYAAIQAATIDVATTALNYGAIQKGVTLDTSQTVLIKNAVGKDITQELYSNGWYLYIPTQSGANRLARTLKGAVFYYVDGQMIQSINLSSTAVL